MGGKKAILVGCNYPGTSAELRGCVNDVLAIKSLLTEVLGFKEADIKVLIDTDATYVKPTGKNMKAALSEMVAGAQDGDVLVFHFSGHGTQVPSDDAEEKDGKDEAICPTDMNLMTDDDLRAIFKPLEGRDVKLTFVADCCHSGTLLDHEEIIITGPKGGAAPPPTFDGPTLAALLGAITNPGKREFKNRALPTNELLDLLSQMLGKPVETGNVRGALGNLFGQDASAKVQTFLKVWNSFSNPTGQAGGAGGNLGGGAGGLMGLLACLCAPPQATEQQQQQPAPAAPAAKPPPAGAKPPASERLGKDVGVLITGCQSTETSADACPDGNPTNAHGALTNALVTVVRQHYQQNPGTPIPYRSVVVGVRDLLGKTGYTQNPCLEGSEANADSAFIIR